MFNFLIAVFGDRSVWITYDSEVLFVLDTASFTLTVAYVFLVQGTTCTCMYVSIV